MPAIRNGFEVTMDCPNDRYVNDEAICQAVTTMLARIGVKVNLLAQPKAKYFEKAGPTKKYDSSFNLLGWTPGSFDSWNVISNIAGCRDADGKGGTFNYGGYCNPKVEDLAKRILVEVGRQEARRPDLRSVHHYPRGGRSDPAAPAGAGVGRVQENQDRATGGQSDPALLGAEAGLR